MHQAADRQAHDIVKITLDGFYANDPNPLLDGISSCLVVWFVVVNIVDDLFC